MIDVVAAAVAGSVIGALWYGPLFGKTWAKEGEKTTKKGDDVLMAQGATLISNIVMAYVLSMFIAYAGVSTPGAAAFVGILAWLGFVATGKVSGVIWEGKTLNQYAIRTGNRLVSMVVMSAILVLV